jgi:hypothetical protein
MEQHAITALCGLHFNHLMNTEEATHAFNAWPAELGRHSARTKAEEPRRSLPVQQHERGKPTSTASNMISVAVAAGHRAGVQ